MLLAGLITGLVLGVGSYWLWQHTYPGAASKSVVATSSTAISANASSSSAAAVPVTKTYTSAQYGFSFAYPSQWTLKEVSGDSNGAYHHVYEVTVTDSLNADSYKAIADVQIGVPGSFVFPNPNDFTVQDVAVGGVTGKRYTSPAKASSSTLVDGDTDETIVSKGSYSYDIALVVSPTLVDATQRSAEHTALNALLTSWQFTK